MCTHFAPLQSLPTKAVPAGDGVTRSAHANDGRDDKRLADGRVAARGDLADITDI
jgi:hypothetical protein